MKHKQLCESHVHLRTTDDLKMFWEHVHTSRRRERGEQITTTNVPALGIAKNLRVESSRGRGSRPFFGLVTLLPSPPPSPPQPCSHSVCGPERRLPDFLQELNISKWSQTLENMLSGVQF